MGFFSIVVKDDGQYHIRARTEQDLHNLADEARLDVIVHTSERADYRYRVITDAAGYGAAMAALTRSVNYPNFKDKIKEIADQRDKLDAYNRIWGEMFGIQARREALQSLGEDLPGGYENYTREQLDELLFGIHPTRFDDITKEEIEELCSVSWWLTSYRRVASKNG